MFCTTAKLSSENRKNSLLTKKKSLVGLAPEQKKRKIRFAESIFFLQPETKEKDGILKAEIDSIKTAKVPPLLNRVTLGQHKNDNYNRMVQ